MGNIVQVRLAGFGGQGIVFMGIILGQAGALESRHVAGSNSYGAQARGSACRSEVILSDEPIDFPHVIKADVLVVLSQGAYVAFGNDVTDSGLLLFDKTQVKPDNAKRMRNLGIPASEYALEILKTRQVANMVMLGALISPTNVVSGDAVKKALAMHAGEPFRDSNLAAFAGGMELAGGMVYGCGKNPSAGHQA